MINDAKNQKAVWQICNDLMYKQQSRALEPSHGNAMELANKFNTCIIDKLKKHTV